MKAQTQRGLDESTRVTTFFFMSPRYTIKLCLSKNRILTDRDERNRGPRDRHDIRDDDKTCQEVILIHDMRYITVSIKEFND